MGPDGGVSEVTRPDMKDIRIMRVNGNNPPTMAYTVNLLVVGDNVYRQSLKLLRCGSSLEGIIDTMRRGVDFALWDFKCYIYK